MAHARPVWLSDDDVNALIDPVALVEALAVGFASVESAVLKERASITMRGLDGASAYLSLFPAHNHESGLASVKVLMGRPENAQAGRPEIDAIVTLADAGTGAFKAIVSAAGLTALRTAGVTTLAVRQMAGNGQHRIGLVGTGAQAKAHARVLAANGLARSFLVASPHKGDERAAAFAQEIAGLTGTAAQSRPVETIARDCDVLITMTLAARPLPLGPFPEGMMLACIGTFLPHAHEIDPGLLQRASLLVSDLPDRLIRQWHDHPLVDFERLSPVALAALLATPLAGKPNGLSIFLSDGRAFEDNVIATLLLKAATKAGRGLLLP
jgi:ornithine cyclodeaminase/alanine dehydrogenase-like protein (mu-crystallin family)